jgi:hypothetical protein
MFYNLLFAHLIADYPLQSTWLIANKSRWGVLGLHAFIHFLTSVIIIWVSGTSIASSLWLYLLLLSVIHFMIDLAKTTLSRIRPEWVKVPYLVDQLLHLVSIMVISILIQQKFGITAFPSNPSWVVLAIAYLFVTYVWYISERVLTHDDPNYRQAVITDFLPRMIFRAGFLSGFLGVWVLTAKTLAAPVGAIYFPYRGKEFGRRAFLTDLGITFGVFVLIRLLIDPSQ